MLPVDFPYSVEKIGSNKADALYEFGFKFGSKGAHTSRTIMTSEINALLAACPEETKKFEYAEAIEEKNILGKLTSSTRHLTYQRLSEIYALDPSIPIFRLFRQYWKLDPNGRPLLGLLAALARDPLLRSTASPVLESRQGEEIAKQEVKRALEQSTGSRINPDVLDKVLRNALSSWTQSGHLNGRSRKIRARAQASSVSTAFALLLGYILGLRGTALFNSLFARTLDASSSEILRLAAEAHTMGIIVFKQMGGIFEISFSGILSSREKELADVAD